MKRMIILLLMIGFNHHWAAENPVYVTLFKHNEETALEDEKTREDCLLQRNESIQLGLMLKKRLIWKINSFQLV